MGKGKRLRNRRERPAAAELPDYPFEVDARIRAELGPEGLAYLAENLWPKDCQTCGWPLGAERPTLVCQDMVMLAQVSLHHRRCREASWSETMVLHDSNAELVSYDVLAFMLPGQKRSAEGIRTRDDRPVFFVNPSLETTTLTKMASGWRGTFLDRLQQTGLRPAGPDMFVDKPIPAAVAQLGIGDLTVTLPPGVRWSCGVNVPFREAVEDMGGVLLAATSAAMPTRMQRLGEFVDLLLAGKVVMGWVQLDVPG
ncbi:hypothetical protein [Amycolatopsis sacchari]|uniref:hypothetical protein n=1 Tax=Amycolatopsis sacchari TaxID=115433 RepID=UPI003D748BEB